MSIVFGLGNPGEEYEKTRHNIGFMAVCRLAERLTCQLSKIRFQSRIGVAIIQDRKIWLALPQTYMNQCGPALKQLLDYTGELPSDALVVCDDFHLRLGQLRLRRNGSAGGHRGLLSICQALQTDDFPRLRIGIEHFGDRDQVEYVLDKFSKAEREKVSSAIDEAADAIETWIAAGMDVAMNRFNQSKESKESS